MMRNIRTLLGLIVVSACALITAGSANLVQNGSFETPISDNNWGQNPASWSAGQTFDGYWYVGQGSIDIVRGQFASTSPYDGDQMIDLNEYRIGSIYQDISINAAGAYTLSFAMNGNYALDTGVPRTMTVSFGSLFTGNYTHNFGDPWVLYSINITVPTAGTYRLTFLSTTDNTGIDNAGAMIDAVSLVPEPASIIAMGVGLVGLALRRRRTA